MHRKATPKAWTVLAAASCVVGCWCSGVAFGQTEPGEPEIEQISDPARFNQQIDLFVEQDRTEPSPPGTVLFVGSSTVRLWPLRDSFPQWETRNRGFGGSTFADAIHFFERLVLPHTPSAVVIYEGDNDIAGGLSPQTVAQQAAILIDRIQVAKPDTAIVLLGIKRSERRQKFWPEFEQTNIFFRDLAETRERVDYFDLDAILRGPDGRPDPALFREDELHIHRDGYALIAQSLADLIRELVPPDGIATPESPPTPTR